MQILETPRLIIRYFTIRDLENLSPILADPQVMEFSIIGVHNSQQIRQFIEQRLLSYIEPGFGLYALIDKQTKELIGYCGFFLQKINADREVEIGYRLATKYWGRGLATEAAQALYQYGRQKFDFKRFVCLIEPDNIRSIRVAQKLGMKLEKQIIYYGINVEMYTVNIDQF
ncbi:GNAT family N-acetyltransferase [Waterburya agarophytonicola K14]|uniref:GNAT family N-acetyltransferase n=1 Tax=Waterburya agarophytonicola KI4 TaxID=2874699 RepID=A0A964BSC6_9CYAN|nr:GNAT family N-acetyltransferase [Waterburya agarophytonicola]MCC0178804.1 GNAT family N-acetyltransferase [Waterburya agarophytonicola KI4]